MVAALLYLIGLAAVLVSIAIIGFGAPAMMQTLSAAMDAGDQNILGVVTGMAASLNWAVTPLVGGLVLMGLGRVIMLLSDINRSLRGQG